MEYLDDLLMSRLIDLYAARLPVVCQYEPRLTGALPRSKSGVANLLPACGGHLLVNRDQSCSTAVTFR